LIPDGMAEANIGINLYSKPGWGLDILRDQVLGADRFDFAFKQYINNWAFKHPTPFDFFRSMENAAGEDLSWFWRSWFLNSWKMDQAIADVKPFKKEGAVAGYLIKINNLEKMPMPIILQVKTKSGKTEVIKVPVDVWMKNTSWTIRYNTTEEITELTLDPEKVLPDANAENNKWIADGASVKTASIANIDSYLGQYGAKEIPVKITVGKADGNLTLQVAGQPKITLNYLGGEKFDSEEEVDIEFKSDKTQFTLTQGGASYIFTKEQ
jgi:hypothetical protein